MTTMKLARPATAMTAAPGTMTGARFGTYGGLTGFVRRWRNRQEAQEMLRLDDKMLDDIGLTRGDIEFALQLPASTDVSGVLNDLRDERRAATWAIMGGRMPARVL